MKPLKLEIGDYILHKGKVVKVDVLSPSDFNLLVANEDGSDYALYKDITGIPLTSSILEQFGFWYKYDGDVDMDRYRSEFFSLHHINNIYVVGNTMMMIAYVHELQHALRLCGNYKEIEL